MNKQKLLAMAAIILTAIFWGISFINIKIAVAVIPPMTLAVSRFLLASAILLFLLRKLEPATRLAPKDRPLMAVAGIIGVTAYFYFENNGVKLTTASSASLIVATIPVLTLLGEMIFFKVKLNLAKIVSVSLSLVGVYLIITVTKETGGESLLGNAFMVGASIAWVIYALVTRPLNERYSQLAIVTYQTLFGTLALIPLSLFEYQGWQPVNGTIIAHVVFLGLFCSALGYYLYVYSMAYLGISTVSLFINLIPVVTVATGYYFLHETVILQQVIGGAVVILSVFLASWEGKAASVEQKLGSSS